MLDSNVSTYIDKDENVQEVGSGGSVDASTLNGVITGTNGITTALNTAGDKVEVKLSNNITLGPQIPLQGKTGSLNIRTFGGSKPVAITLNDNGISTLFGTPDGNPDTSINIVEDGIKYVDSSGASEVTYNYLREGNVKTVNGKSIYGSGDIKSYPIGSIYQSTSSARPASLFGGTWTALSNVGLDESLSLVMTSGSIESFIFTEGSGTVSSIDMELSHNEDYSIIQISGRMRVTATSNVGGRVRVAYDIGSNIIKKQFMTQCGFYVNSDGTRESLVAQVNTNGLIEFFNNATMLNIPTSQTIWAVDFTLFNKSSDGETLYRWKRIA